MLRNKRFVENRLQLRGWAGARKDLVSFGSTWGGSSRADFRAGDAGAEPEETTGVTAWVNYWVGYCSLRCSMDALNRRRSSRAIGRPPPQPRATALAQQPTPNRSDRPARYRHPSPHQNRCPHRNRSPNPNPNRDPGPYRNLQLRHNPSPRPSPRLSRNLRVHVHHSPHPSRNSQLRHNPGPRPRPNPRRRRNLRPQMNQSLTPRKSRRRHRRQCSRNPSTVLRWFWLWSN